MTFGQETRWTLYILPRTTQDFSPKTDDPTVMWLHLQMTVSSSEKIKLT